VWLPFRLIILGGRDHVVALVERRTRSACSRRPSASPGGTVAGVRSPGDHLAAYVASATLAGLAGIIYSSNIMAADANAAGELVELYAILAVGWRHAPAGREVQHRGHIIGVLIIQTLNSTILFLGVPSAEHRVLRVVVIMVV